MSDLSSACRRGDKAAAESILAEARGGALALIRDSDALCEACDGGHLEVARWLVTAFDLTDEEMRNMRFRSLLLASESGHLDVVELLMKTFSYYIPAECDDALSAACAEGHYAVASLLGSRSTQGCVETALLTVCSNGSLEDVQRFVDRCVRYRPHVLDVGMPAALRSGRNDVATWLASWHITWLTAYEVYAACSAGDTAKVESILAVLGQHQMSVAAHGHIHEALVEASFCGHLAIVRLLTPFCLLSDDYGDYKRRSLCNACSKGFLEVAKWLAAELKLVEARGRGTPCDALCDACSNGHLAVAQWLVVEFDLTIDGVCGGRDDNRQQWVHRLARGRGYRDVAAWLDKWKAAQVAAREAAWEAEQRIGLEEALMSLAGVCKSLVRTLTT